MRWTGLLLLVLLLVVVAGASADTPAKAGPKADLASVLDHSRENVEDAQKANNDEYVETRAACDQMVESMSEQMKPKQAALLSAQKILRDRLEKADSNGRLEKELRVLADSLEGRAESLRLRMAALVHARDEDRHFSETKAADTVGLLDSVKNAMTLVSNAHERLNATAKPDDPKRASGYTDTEAARHSFALLHLLHHQLGAFATGIPDQEKQAESLFAAEHARLDSERRSAIDQARKTVARRRRIKEETKYFREYAERTRDAFAKMEQDLALLQAEITAVAANCENERREFRVASANRKAELQGLTDVQRLVNEKLTDADFLPVLEVKLPPAKPAPKPADVEPVSDAPNADAKPAPHGDDTERNVIYG